MADKILIIEDEEKIARFIELELKHEGYEVSICYDGRSGLETVEKEKFECILLDIMLPQLNGIEVLRRIRKTSDVPIIMLTARDAVMDKVSGLDMGADDYVTKPFAIEELLARIRLVMRKNSKTIQTLNDIVFGKLEISVSRHEVKYDGNLIDLTSKEFTLLQTLLENKNVVMSRDSLLEKVWGYDYIGETNVVDVYIRYIRAKIDDIYNVKIIQTIRGVGYVIKDH